MKFKDTPVYEAIKDNFAPADGMWIRKQLISIFSKIPTGFVDIMLTMQHDPSAQVESHYANVFVPVTWYDEVIYELYGYHYVIRRVEGQERISLIRVTLL